MPTHRGLRQPAHNFSNTDKVVGNTGALALIGLDLLLDIGGLTEQYRYYFEDVQLNIECLVRGKDNYYIGSSVSYHYESVNWDRESMDKTVKQTQDLDNILRPYMNNNAKVIEKFYETN
jgi:GT2 family glycosyltransferase